MQSNTRPGQENIRFEGGTNVLPAEGTDTAQILINDHKVIKQLLSELCHAQQASQRKSTLEKLKAALTIHNSMEENLVYPALQIVAGKKHEAQNLYKETAEADVLVFELDTMLKSNQDSTFSATAEKLQSAILEHIDDEEQKAIPDLREHATPEQATMLLNSVREFRSGLQVK